MPSALARLERVPLREAWPNEAGDFTPWLAQPENLALLGETIGLELEGATCENAVGDFSADIICQNTYDDKLVLIENQIERTDHSHLGQLLTYTAGRKASVIVWIARTFREEHRAALDWLNENTTEEFSFFGLEVELWRIADSPPAPKFNIVCQPNDWSRRERVSARSGELTAGAELQRDYWTAFFTYLEDSGWKGRMRTPNASNWIGLALGVSGFRLCVATSTTNQDKGVSKGPEIRVELLIDGPGAAHNFEALETKRDEINAALSPEIAIWHIREGVQQRRIYVQKDADIRNRNDWPNQHEWLRQRLQKFDQVFRPVIAGARNR